MSAALKQDPVTRPPIALLAIDDLAQMARLAIEMARAEEKRANERIYGLDAIAAEVGVHRNTVLSWIENKGFPVDHDPKGHSITRWNLERWFDAKRVACETYQQGKRRR